MSHSGTDLIRVLHVDDEPDLLEITSIALEQHDERFDIVTESNVETVVDAHDWSIRITESWASGARFEIGVDD